ncbi:MAG: toxin ParE1/3/4 [Flavobacteriales bacterium]|jgi:toxin ParE1/3/4
MTEKRDLFRERLLIIPEISMIISSWVDGEAIRVMRFLHQKQNFSPE